MIAKITKQRLLLLLKLLYTDTDEQHSISTTELYEYFERLDMRPDRKTLKADIELLIETGIDVVEIPGNPIRYFIGNRSFELPEVKLLIDAVQSSRFITAKKSKALTKKLATRLASKHQAMEITRTLYTIDRIKPANEQIYLFVDTIHTAISGKKQIIFQYIEYSPEKKRIAKHDGQTYELSPYALLWNGDYYYCVGFSNTHGKIATFRVDRMKNLKPSELAAKPSPDTFDVQDYYTGVFYMYDGEEMTVELLCENKHMKSIVDRFGEAVETRIIDPEHFTVSVAASVSPTFFAWVFQFCGEIKIISPQSVADRYREMCNK